MTRSKPDTRSAQFDLIGRICDFLNTRGYFVWHQANHGRFDADHAADRLVELVTTLRLTPNVLPRQVEKAVKAALAESWRRVPHTTRGVADIIGLHRSGTFVAVEVKIGADRLSDDQSVWLARVRDFRGRAVVVGDFADFKRLFERPAARADVVPGAAQS